MMYLMSANKKKKIIENSYLRFCNSDSIYISVADFFMEGGFDNNCTLHEKQRFYAGAEKFADYIRMISLVINEDTSYIGSFVKHENNYYKWKDIKNFDAYNTLKAEFGKREIRKISISKSKLVDLIVECNLRYLSRIMFYLPENELFIILDMHCYIEIFGNSEKLDKLYSILSIKNNNGYIITKEINSEAIETQEQF